MTKIIHVIHHSLSFALPKERLEIGIYESWAARVAKRVLEASNEFEVECFTPERTYKTMQILERDGITFKVFPSFAVRSGYEVSFQLLKEIKRLSKENKNTLLHIHGLHYPFVSLMAYLFRNMPILVQHHGETPYPKLKTFWEPLTLRNLNRVFAISKMEVDYIQKIVPKERVKMQGMGVDFEFCKPVGKEKAREQLGLPKDKKLLLYVGAPYKIRWREFLEAVKNLKKRTDVELLLIDRERNEMFEEAEKMGAICLAPVPREKMPLYYNAADVYVLYGTNRIASWGGIGIAPVEAAACGTPMVSTNLIHFPTEEWEGIGIIPNNGLEKALEEALNTPERFKNCREIAQKYYDWKSVITGTVEAYRELLS